MQNHTPSHPALMSWDERDANNTITRGTFAEVVDTVVDTVETIMANPLGWSSSPRTTEEQMWYDTATLVRASSGRAVPRNAPGCPAGHTHTHTHTRSRL
jgi:hypothetical protein